MSPPNSSVYLSLNNEEDSKPWEVRLNVVGKHSLTPSSDLDRSIAFDADAVLTLLLYLQERRETIALHAEQHRIINADLG